MITIATPSASGVDPEAVLAHLPLTDQQFSIMNYLNGTRPGEAERTFAPAAIGRLRNTGYIQRGAPGDIGFHSLTSEGRVALKVHHEHRWSSHRRFLGGSPVRGGGHRWGLGARCACSFVFQTNESGTAGRRELARQHREHVRDYFLGKEDS